MSDQLTTDVGSPSTTDAATSAAKDTAAAAAERSKAVAGTASNQAADVVADVRGQLGSVTTEAKDQAQRVMSTAGSDLESQLGDRLSKAAEAARTTANELVALAEGRPEDAGRSADLARQAGQRLEHLADRADELGPRGVAEELSDFARRRPAAFLLGAATAGLLAGRLARAGKEVSSSSSTSRTDAASPAQPAMPVGMADAPGLAGSVTVPIPATPPVSVPPAAVPPAAVPPLAGSPTIATSPDPLVEPAGPAYMPGQVR